MRFFMSCFYEDQELFFLLGWVCSVNNRLWRQFFCSADGDFFFSRRVRDRGDAVPRGYHLARSPAKVPLHALRHDVTIQLHHEASHAQNVNKLLYISAIGWSLLLPSLFWNFKSTKIRRSLEIFISHSPRRKSKGRFRRNGDLNPLPMWQMTASKVSLFQFWSL